MKRLPALHLLVALEAIARHESVTQAAQELHLTASAVSHRLGNLQEFLGVRLFVKRHDGIALTPQGHRYSIAARDLLQQMDRLSTVLGECGGESLVKLRTSPGFAEFWLLPRLPDFRDAYPGIHIEVESSFEPVDFRTQAIDLWVSRARPSDSALVTETLITEHFVPLASPAYLRRHALNCVSDLSTDEAIYCTRSSPNWTDWFKTYCDIAHNMDWALAFSHAAHALQAATQGLGVVLESREIAEPFLRDSRLSLVFEHSASIIGPGHAMVYPEQHLNRPAVAAFTAWLRSKAATADARN